MKELAKILIDRRRTTPAPGTNEPEPRREPDRHRRLGGPPSGTYGDPQGPFRQCAGGNRDPSAPALGEPFYPKDYLGRFSRLPIIAFENQEPLQEGFIFIPPAGRSATFSGGMITVEDAIPQTPARTINRLFTSAAHSYRERVIGVILSGVMRDGTDGLRAVHNAGGLTIVQDPREAEYPEMPINAMERLDVTLGLNLAEIGPALELLVRRTTRFETGLEVAVRTLRDRTALLARLSEQSSRNPGTREFLVDELASLRREIESIDDFLKVSSLGEK